MSAPSSDSAGVRQTIRALKAAGYELLEVFDGEENVKVTTETEALAVITNLDDATLFVRTPEGDRNPWVRFVLGNDPDEVVADYVTILEPALAPMFERWND